jgi:hypothetical protein
MSVISIVTLMPVNLVMSLILRNPRFYMMTFITVMSVVSMMALMRMMFVMSMLAWKPVILS